MKHAELMAPPWHRLLSASAVSCLLLACPGHLDDPNRFCAVLGADGRCTAAAGGAAAWGPPDGATLVAADHFDRGNLANWGIEAAQADDIQVVAGQACFALKKADPLWNGDKRAELKYGDSDFLTASHVVEFALAVPADYAYDAARDVIMEFVGTMGGKWYKPNLEFAIDEDQVKLSVQWYTNGDPSAPLIEKKLWSDPLQKGKTTDWRFLLHFATGKDGLIQVWKDRALVFEYAGQNTDGAKDNLTFKFGISKWGWPNGEPSTTTARNLCFDNVTIWRLP